MLTLIELAKRRRVEIRPFASLTPLIVSPNPPSKRRRKGGANADPFEGRRARSAGRDLGGSRV